MPSPYALLAEELAKGSRAISCLHPPFPKKKKEEEEEDRIEKLVEKLNR
jgi:hypothetical protein